MQYVYNPKDSGILFTGLSAYQAQMKKDLDTFPQLPECIKKNFKDAIKRIDEILEKL